MLLRMRIPSRETSRRVPTAPCESNPSNTTMRHEPETSKRGERLRSGACRSRSAVADGGGCGTGDRSDSKVLISAFRSRPGQNRRGVPSVLTMYNRRKYPLYTGPTGGMLSFFSAGALRQTAALGIAGVGSDWVLWPTCRNIWRSGWRGSSGKWANEKALKKRWESGVLRGHFRYAALMVISLTDRF